MLFYFAQMLSKNSTQSKLNHIKQDDIICVTDVRQAIEQVIHKIFKEVSQVEVNTREKIVYSSFKLFLENGYEATNIRDICKDVGIKASTLYFYFPSKQDLFFHIYDSIWHDYIKFIQNIEALTKDITVEEKLYMLLTEKIDYYVMDISKRKFIFRYQLFPPEEISNVIREKYLSYTDEENKIVTGIIESAKSQSKLENISINEFLFQFRNLEYHLVYEMIQTSLKINRRTLQKIWEIFWNDILEYVLE